jgi:hypothetical protein
MEVGAFEEFDLEALVGRSAADINDFIAKDALFEADYRAMLEAGLGRKELRGTLVNGLRVLTGR